MMNFEAGDIQLTLLDAWTSDFLNDTGHITVRWPCHHADWVKLRDIMLNGKGTACDVFKIVLWEFM
jgi:hypothetical protein